jgi:serine/threonine-protein kinase
MERRGAGTYGAVYRAFGVEEGLGPVALKLALHPADERFSREGELLSRIRHPHVPRLVDHGLWQSPQGLPYPFLVMQWIEGVPLYDWARVQCPTSRRVLHVLARLARALEATHAAASVHRDVKGDNVLVRASDGHVFLIDFGAGHFVGAAPLTSPPFPPGTPPYRSPEAYRSVRLPMPASATAYAPQPADDVFALGITAYRLVAGEYPPSTAPTDRAPYVWKPEGPGPLPLRAVNARCCAQLSELVSRMLSVPPEARGSARELAEALEQAARKAGPKADVPLFAREDSQPVDVRAVPRHVVPRAPERARQSWLTAAAGLGGAVALGAAWMRSAHSTEEVEQVHASAPEEARDGGVVAVGDTALTAPVPLTRSPSAWSTVAEELPPKPLPGQARPNAAGRCPSPTLIHINGGCWVKLDVRLKDCDANYNQYVHKGACYGPAYPPARPPTSSPTEQSGDSAP